MEHRAKTTLSFLSRKNGLKPVFNAFYESMLIQKSPKGGMSKLFFDDAVSGVCLSGVVTSGQLDDFWKLISNYSERDRWLLMDDVLMLAIWRLTQGIYRFDPTVYEAVIDTSLDGDIPFDLLDFLPEWVVYVETPGMTYPVDLDVDEPLYGIWARWSLIEGQKTLTLYADLDIGVYPSFTTLVSHGTFEDSLKETERLSKMEMPELYVDNPERIAKRFMVFYRKCMNLLLFLCSQTEYSSQNKIVAFPQFVEPKHVKGGARFFPPPDATLWNVGTRLGAALREAQEAVASEDGETHSGSTVRPHIRRAHWHTYHVGAKKAPNGDEIPPDKREIKLEWLPPIPVNLKDFRDELPAVIHSVK
jgi:hypothetical protein